MGKVDFSHAATISRAGNAFKKRDERQSDYWEEAWQYTFPYRDLSEAATGTPRHKVIYDNTPVDAASRLVNTILTGLVPPWVPWFRLSPGVDMELTALEGEDPDGDLSDLQRSLDRATSMIQSHINASNFHRVMQEAFSDMVIACGVIAVEPDLDKESIKFVDVPLDQVALVHDEYGDIKFIYHQLEMLNATALANYGDKIPSNLRMAMEKNPSDKITVLISVEHNPEKGRWLKRRFLWAKSEDTWTNLTPVAKMDVVLEEEELDYSPYHVARWSVLPNNPYGEGPGLKALADMRTLNNLMQNYLQKVKIEAAGIYTALDDDTINPYNLEIQAGTVITVGSNDNANPTIRRLDTNTNAQFVGTGIEDLREIIKRQMHSKLFTPTGRTPLTATEVASLQDDIAREMGAAFGILTSEFLIPLIRTIMKLLSKFEKYKELFEGIDVDGIAYTIEFLGTIARAQRKREGSEQIQLIGTVSQLAQAIPEFNYILDSTSVMRDALANIGVEDRFIRNEKELAKQIQNAQGGMAAAQQGPLGQVTQDVSGQTPGGA